MSGPKKGEAYTTFSIRSGDNFVELYNGKYYPDRKNGMITLKLFDQSVPEEEINVLSVDSSKMKTFLSLKYELSENVLILNNDSLNIKLNKLR
jgi:hypothetical protein